MGCPMGTGMALNVPAVHELPQAVGRRCDCTEPCTGVLWAGAVLGIRSQIHGAPAGFGFRVSVLSPWGKGSCGLGVATLPTLCVTTRCLRKKTPRHRRHDLH